MRVVAVIDVVEDDMMIVNVTIEERFGVETLAAVIMNFEK